MEKLGAQSAIQRKKAANIMEETEALTGLFAPHLRNKPDGEKRDPSAKIFLTTKIFRSLTKIVVLLLREHLKRMSMQMLLGIRNKNLVPLLWGHTRTGT
jgi:hypothetical protein